MFFSLNGVTYFVDLPRVTKMPPWLFKLASMFRSKLLKLLTDALLRNRDTTFGENLFYFPGTEKEALVQPERMAENFSKNVMTLRVGRLGLFRSSLAGGQLS